jgi:WD40 repeat protein
MTSIFLSYARDDDEAFVRRLHADLISTGFDVWFDRVSMPSRQLTFHQEIRDAIAVCERLLLVVGPEVLTSDYVTQEWRFAYLEAGKCVNPIVRLNGRSTDGSIIDGYELIPEDLKLLHAEDFRDNAHYDAHFANLIRQLSEEIPPVGKLVAVPELPVCFLAQPDRIKALRDLLLVDLQKPVVVSGAAARVGLQGMGGIGKSVLASALAHRPEVRRAFPDGVFWITLGQKPQLAELQRWLARELGDEALFADERSGKECLRKLLAGRRALLVMDDVWQREDAEAFNVIGAMGRILLTTRDTALVTALASKETHYRVELPTEAEAEGIFAAAAQLKLEELPVSVREIVAQCGRLPLALALCGGMVQGGVSPADVLEALREHDLEFLSSDHPAEEQHRNTWKAMDVSLRVLTPEQRDRFAELAVFALDRGAPEAAVVTLWEHKGRLAPRNARKLLAEFAARSLVQLSPAKEVGGEAGIRMTLHDLLHNFAEGMAEKLFGSRAALHQTLLDAYRKKCPSGWPSGPDDGYYFQNFCEHLLAAGRIDDTVELLIGLPWIEAKCKAKLVFSLQDDYRNTIAQMPEAQEGLRRERQRQARLVRWAAEITDYSRRCSERHDQLTRGVAASEFEPYLLPSVPTSCRMWTEGEIEAECQRIIENPTRLDRMQAFARFVEHECYPLLEVGVRPGFVVQHAFNYAPRGLVHEVATRVLPSMEVPLLIRHWCVSDRYNPKPALLRTLEGHASWVWSMSVTPDGRHAVSGSDDETVRVWDLETGVCLRVLRGHIRGVYEVSVTPDNRRAVSVGSDKTERVWDLETGACLRVLEGHTDCLNSVTVTNDSRRAISGSGPCYRTTGEKGKTLQVWDLETGVCLRVLEGHTDEVTSVSVIPDGRLAVSSSFDKTLRVWDLETGVCLRVLEGHTKWVRSVSVTPDSQHAVSGSDDETVRVWDLETGVCLRVLKGHTGRVRSVSVTPDSRHVISAGSDMTVRVWDIEVGTCLKVLEGHTDEVTCVSVTSEGDRAVSVSWDKTARVWDLETGACLRTLEHIHSVTCVSVTADSKCAVTAGDKTARVWDLETGACLHVLRGHKDDLFNISVTPDGRRVVSAGTTVRLWDLETGACLRVLEGNTGSISGLSVTPDSTRVVLGIGAPLSSYSDEKDETVLRVWDLETGMCLHVLRGHTHGVWSVSATPDNRCAVSAGFDRTLRVWDLETGGCIRVLEGHTDEVRSVSVTPDGCLAVSASFDKTIRVWDLETGICLRVLEGHTDRVRSVSVTPDGRRAVSGSNDKTLRVWDLETGACLRVLEGHTSWVTSVSVTADGQQAFSASLDKTLRVWDLEAGTCMRHTDPVISVIVTSDSQRAISGSGDKAVRVWDLDTGVCLRVLEGHTKWVWSVSRTADDRFAVSASEDETVRVWDLETGTCLRVLQGHTKGVRSVSVTPDSRFVVSASEDETVRVWDLETGVCLRVLEGHSSYVTCVSVTADNRYLVSASWDKTVRVWDLETGACLRVLEGHRDHVTCVSVTADSRFVVSASWDKTVRVWDFRTGLCLRVLEGPTDRVESVRVIPDSRYVVSASRDKTLRVWDFETGACLVVARTPFQILAGPDLRSHGRLIVGTQSGEVLQFDLRGMTLTAISQATQALPAPRTVD